MKLQQPVPVLRMLDEAKAREFYVDFLGFAIDFEHGFDGRWPYPPMPRSLPGRPRSFFVTGLRTESP